MKLLLVLLLAGLCTCAPGGVGDASDLVDTLLLKVNRFINSQNLNAISLPKAVEDGLFVTKTFENGKLRDFGTIKRIGNASIVPAVQGKVVNWVIQTRIGLKWLEIESDYSLSIMFGLFKPHGHISVGAKENVLDIEATVITNSQVGTCNLVINDLAVVSLGGFKVQISHAGIFKFILERVAEYVIKYIIPTFRETINMEMHDFIRTYPVNKEITGYVCKYFLPDSSQLPINEGRIR